MLRYKFYLNILQLRFVYGSDLFGAYRYPPLRHRFVLSLGHQIYCCHKKNSYMNCFQCAMMTTRQRYLCSNSNIKQQLTKKKKTDFVTLNLLD